jgi:hypothetical protein
MATTYNKHNEMTASRRIASVLRSIFARQESAIILL